ncbi:MAG: endo alpha-1,4 polygalactosaminidase [Lachnospiraceae bacterium]|nr:endo alpha-1,4 polygalactosaminidase [Lachnospiraceae bacterium]
MKESRKLTHNSPLTKRLAALVLAAVLSFAAIVPVTEVPAEAAAKTTTWGVFIGTTLHGNTSKVKNYKSIVIDGQNYTKAEIKKLKSGGRKVYSYLSIGSIATYRSYYKRFKKYTLGKYDNWPDERWVDTSKKAWQDFVVNELVANLRKKGIDGLWVDNTDVYYEFHRTSILNGLISILSRCHNKKIPIIINGGDVFVSKIISMGKAKIIDGVMQEEVLTRITGYNSNKFARQLKSDRTYYEAYLKKVKKAGRSIALLEYTKSSAMRKEIINYCKKRGYSYYISNNVALK